MTKITLWPCGILGLLLVGCTPSQAGRANALPVAADGQIDPGCTAPVPPSANTDPLAISMYQTARRQFMDCVAKGQSVSQQELDLSLAAIGNDQMEGADEAQQDVRGALNKLGDGNNR